MNESQSDRIRGLSRIAVYLDISLKTLHRWMKADLSMPLCRILGGNYYAFKSELDEWERGNRYKVG